MTHEPFEASDVDAVQSHLQRLLDDLPPEQGVVVETLLEQAATAGRADVGPLSGPASTGDDRAIIVVGGRSGRIRVPLDRATRSGLNPQPLPPEESFE